MLASHHVFTVCFCSFFWRPMLEADMKPVLRFPAKKTNKKADGNEAQKLRSMQTRKQTNKQTNKGGPKLSGLTRTT